MKKKYFLLLLLIFTPKYIIAAEIYNSTWLGAFAKHVLTQEYFIWHEAQLRYRLDSSGMQQTLYRLGALKKLNEQHEIGIIYAYVQTGLMKEHRPTLQHTHQLGKLSSVNFLSRARLEARFLEESTDDSARFRYMLRAQRGLTGNVSLVIWNETFLNLTNDEWTGNRTLERNRFFLGARIPFHNLNVEVGYMHQYVSKFKDSIDHIITAYLLF
jgi:hypothetical protein